MQIEGGEGGEHPVVELFIVEPHHQVELPKTSHEVIDLLFPEISIVIEEIMQVGNTNLTTSAAMVVVVYDDSRCGRRMIKKVTTGQRGYIQRSMTAEHRLQAKPFQLTIARLLATRFRPFFLA